MVMDTLRRSITKIRLGAAGAALTLVVVLLLVLGTTQWAQAQTIKVLFNFTGGSDGGIPYAGLIRDAKGNLYGTTSHGGSFVGYGLVFKLDKMGKETILYSFSGQADGGYPYAPLIRDSVGNLYGTAELGGVFGNGTLFKVTRGGRERVLHSFAGGTSDGCSPTGGLLLSTSGDLYGTTEGCGAFGFGTVFKLSKNGTETVLHSFAGGTTDGQYPQLTSLVMDRKGNLYGVTNGGGTSRQGVVYKLNKRGTETVLHSFTGGTTDGCYAFGAPAIDNEDNLYGTTSNCGSNNVGIVWKLSKQGIETVLHSFVGGSSDGSTPTAGVTIDAKGNLFGDTGQGGTSDKGAIYKLSKNGTLILLHSFDSSDGDTPLDNLILDAKGNLYGTASLGGSGGYGTVWKLTP
jgi:uncharacterized repeat protein (TIGR03803 family)